MFLSVIHEKISHLSTRQTTENNKNTLELRNEIVNEELKLFHNKVGVVPIYKVMSPLSAEGIMLKFSSMY